MVIMVVLSIVVLVIVVDITILADRDHMGIIRELLIAIIMARALLVLVVPMVILMAVVIICNLVNNFMLFQPTTVGLRVS